MNVVVVSGTGTEVGKTVVTAAVAALAAEAGRSVAVVKPAQTGVRPGGQGDVGEVARLADVSDVHELARYPDPLAPAAAARLSGAQPVDLRAAAVTIAGLARTRDLVLVEGSGGLLVRFDADGTTIADLAGWLAAPVLVVTRPDLGTLNHTALTLEALEHRGLASAGVVVGTWPASPDLACRSNIRDLEDVAGAPLAGAMPAGTATLSPEAFLDAARSGLGPALGGTFDGSAFRTAHDPEEHS